MSILDNAGQLTGGGLKGGDKSPLRAVLGLINNHPGGISGLVQSFEQQGLGGVVQSWIGTGQNQPVSGEQVQTALGNDKIQELAAKLGTSPEAASSTVAQYLPQVIDHLTPNGQIPSHSANLMEMGESLLQKFLK
jgi:uncharacterized protein YidB (DUF937 family)